MKKIGLAVGAVIASVGWSAPAQANIKFGDWLLMTKGKECQLGQLNPAGSILLIRMTTTGTLAVEATGASWDIGKGESVNIAFQALGGGTRNFDYAKGYLSRDGWGGFSDTVSDANRAGFIRDMQAGSKLNILKDGKPLDSFSLSGSSDGLSALQRCAGQIIVKNARTMHSATQAKIATFNTEIAYDAANRWNFLRYDNNSTWMAQMVGFKDGIVTYRVHYSFNRGTPGYVDVKEQGDYRNYCYWDRPNYCHPVRIYGAQTPRR